VCHEEERAYHLTKPVDPGALNELLAEAVKV